MQASIGSLPVELSGQHSVLLVMMCERMDGVLPTRESPLSLGVPSCVLFFFFLFFFFLNRQGTLLWLTLVFQSLVLTTVKGPTISYTASSEDVA